MDPVLVNLLGNARSEAVRREFLSTPPEEYTQLHDVTVLVGYFRCKGGPMLLFYSTPKSTMLLHLDDPVAKQSSAAEENALLHKVTVLMSYAAASSFVQGCTSCMSGQAAVPKGSFRLHTSTVLVWLSSCLGYCMQLHDVMLLA